MKKVPRDINSHPKDLLLLYVEGLLSAEESASVMNHLNECIECSQEVEVISQTISLLKNNKSVFCPEPWELAELAMGRCDRSGDLMRHIERCSSCAADLEELSSSVPSSLPSRLWAAVQDEYGLTDKKRNRFSWVKSLGFYTERLASAFKAPIMGLGAVAALLVMFVLIQGLPLRGGPVVAFSRVTWEESSSGLIPKGPINLMGAARTKKTAAVIIFFNSEKDALPPQEIDKLYEELKPDSDLRARFKMLAPETVQTKLGLTGKVSMSKNELLQELHDKCAASLTALVSLGGSRGGYEAQIEIIELPSQSVVYSKKTGPLLDTQLGEQLRVFVQDALEQTRVN